MAVVKEPIRSQKIKQDKSPFDSLPEPLLQRGWQRPSVIPRVAKNQWKKSCCLKPGFSLVKRTSPLLILTGMFKACFHASVESVPPLPSFQLFLFLCVVQTESFILHLSRQFAHPLLGFLHQCVEVHRSAFQADNWKERDGLTRFFFPGKRCFVDRVSGSLLRVFKNAWGKWNLHSLLAILLW